MQVPQARTVHRIGITDGSRTGASRSSPSRTLGASVVSGTLRQPGLSVQPTRNPGTHARTTRPATPPALRARSSRRSGTSTSCSRRPAPRASSASTCTSSTRSPAPRRSRVFATEAERAPPGADGRHRGPLHTDDTAQPAHPRPAGRLPGRPAGAQLRRVRHPGLLPGLGPPGHRPCHRPRAGPDAAGHDHRVRRLAHRDPRRVRGPGVRHRHVRGGDGAGHPDPAPATAALLRGARRRPAQARCDGQGHHPQPHLAHRRRRRHRATSSSTPARPSGASRWRSG